MDIWANNHDLVLSFAALLGLGFGSVVWAILYSGSS